MAELTLLLSYRTSVIRYHLYDTLLNDKAGVEVVLKFVEAFLLDFH